MYSEFLHEVKKRSFINIVCWMNHIRGLVRVGQEISIKGREP